MNVDMVTEAAYRLGTFCGKCLICVKHVVDFWLNSQLYLDKAGFRNIKKDEETDSETTSLCFFLVAKEY